MMGIAGDVLKGVFISVLTTLFTFAIVVTALYLLSKYALIPYLIEKIPPDISDLLRKLL